MWGVANFDGEYIWRIERCSGVMRLLIDMEEPTVCIGEEPWCRTKTLGLRSPAGTVGTEQL